MIFLLQDILPKEFIRFSIRKSGKPTLEQREKVPVDGLTSYTYTQDEAEDPKKKAAIFSQGKMERMEGDEVTFE